ncbi:MAG: DUF952 domain-containing protein [Planctomycetes bacterium]|jgi:uncharacterized protein (DUF952 family)|nr:DUF952 domain-containing protein [Planctomycetota bacterium]
MLVYKILRQAEWQALERHGELQGSPVDLRDGFVHLSNAAQVAETAARHFAGADDLVLLAFEAAALGAALRWEPSRGGALFPHLFRALRHDEVLWHAALAWRDGRHQFPDLQSGRG